jgi:hypothetical protein
MKRQHNIGTSIVLAILSVAPVFAQPQSASVKAARVIPPHAVPLQISVRVYNFARVPPTVLLAAFIEAERELPRLPVALTWIDCLSREQHRACESPQAADLTVRLLSTALPQSDKHAIGATLRSAYGDSGALFYDRVVALRRSDIFLPQILGRTMAHEIGHLLLPVGFHSDVGLMRGQWCTEDLRIGSLAPFGLSPRAVQLMRQEVLRRATAARMLPGGE